MRIGPPILAQALAVILLSNPVTAAQIWTDGNGDGLPDTSPIAVSSGANVAVDIWIDAEGFSWTNFQTVVQYQDPCLQSPQAQYTIAGGVNFPPETPVTPTVVVLNGFGYSEAGVDKIGNVTFQMGASSPCCVTPMVDPQDPSGYFSALGIQQTFELFTTSSGTCFEIQGLSGAIDGTVTAGCPTPGTPLAGVKVDVYDTLGALVAGTVTDNSGYSSFTGLDAGSYTTTVVTPLGYQATAEDIETLGSAGQTTTVDFALNCITIISDPRPSGFWKHQVGLAVRGNGNPQFTGPVLCGFLDVIAEHFNGNAVNPVIVYDPPESGVCADKLQAAKVLLNLKGSAATIDKARQQLMSVLLNVAAGYLSQTASISADGATVSQAITYCDQLIDNPSGNHAAAQSICDDINAGKVVAAGLIPLTTEDISYKTRLGAQGIELSQNSPNPFRSSTEISLALPAGTEYTLTIFNAVGQRVRQYSGTGRMGAASVSWDGRDDAGADVAAGTYVYQLRAGEAVMSRRMVLVQ
jgi:hypothetical protein